MAGENLSNTEQREAAEALRAAASIVSNPATPPETRALVADIAAGIVQVVKPNP